MDFTRVPVLNYHKIEIKNDIGITTRHPDDFLRDMEYLSSHGFTPVTFQSTALPEKPVMITFDDGYASVYEQAFPVLTRFDFKAVIFVPAAFIGKTNDWDVQFANYKFRHLSQEQIRALSAAGHEIAAHGMKHHPFTLLNSKALRFELEESRAVLEALSGKAVSALCYPFGRFDQRVIGAVREAGYRYAMASLYLGRPPEEEPNLTLRRFNVYRFDSLQMIEKKLRAHFNSAIAYRDWVLQLGGRATPFYQRFTGRFKRGAS